MNGRMTKNSRRKEERQEPNTQSIFDQGWKHYAHPYTKTCERSAALMSKCTDFVPVLASLLKMNVHVPFMKCPNLFSSHGSHGRERSSNEITSPSHMLVCYWAKLYEIGLAI